MLKSRTCKISKGPGVYRWWIDSQGTEKITSALRSIDLSKLQKRTIDNKTFYALYFGIAKDLRMRLNWHINQHHTASAIRSGYLSTLRCTFSALLGLDCSKSEDAVNDFQDMHCCVEFEDLPSRETAEGIEKTELRSKYYPLNLQGNKVVDKVILHDLSKLRTKTKK